MVIARARRSTGCGSYLTIVTFTAIYLIGFVYWPQPLWVIGFYLVASLICFWLYWADKRRARCGGWRISEGALLVWGFIGGWPGAILAQQMLRHKTQKRSFRQAFWATVIVNVLLLVLLGIPILHRLID